MPKAIDQHEVRRLLDGSGQVVEVLPRGAYEQEHIAGAVEHRDGLRGQLLQRDIDRSHDVLLLVRPSG